MCLIVDENAKIRRTFRKVPCWKVLFREMDGRLYAPYRKNFEYRLGEGRKLSGKLRIVPAHFPYIGSSVHEGFHTFVNKEDAKTACDNWNNISGMYGYNIVVPAFIPRFAKFVVGKNEGGVPCYASDRLFIEKLKIFEKWNSKLETWLSARETEG